MPSKKRSALNIKKVAAAKSRDKKICVNKILTAIVFVFIGCFAVFFEYLYFKSFSNGVIFRHRNLFFTSCAALTFLIVSCACFLGINNEGFTYKLCLSLTVFFAVFTAILYFGKRFNLFAHLRDVSSLRARIEKFGALAVPAFLFLQILQVTVLPVPGMAAIAVGVALFGEFKGALYSFIGITAGSFIAFFIGRVLGYKAVCFLAGEKNVSALLEKLKGRDKVVISAMLLLPFFPDDLLCFVAGLSSMGAGYFACIAIITRLISSFLTAYSLGGKILPYDTWWGVLLWGAIIAGAFFAAKKIYDKGEVFEKRVSRVKELWKSFTKKTK